MNYFCHCWTVVSIVRSVPVACRACASAMLLSTFKCTWPRCLHIMHWHLVTTLVFKLLCCHYVLLLLNNVMYISLVLSDLVPSELSVLRSDPSLLWLQPIMPSVLWCCWLGSRKGIRPVKNWVVGCWRGCLGWSADLHISQQMPLPLTISCSSSKSRLVLTFLVLPFWYLLTRVVPDIFQKSSKMVVCVCVCSSSSI